MKFALVSHVVPPAWSGQAMVLYKLLKQVDPESYCVIASASGSVQSENGYAPKLEARHYAIPSEKWVDREGRCAAMRERSALIAALWRRARAIRAVVQKEQCGAIVACSGGADLLDLPAAYLASRLARVRFYPYMFDHYLYQWDTPWPYWPKAKHSLMARCFESVLVRGAAGVIVPNEFMQAALLRRYKVSGTIVRNPCDVNEYETIREDTDNTDGREVRIVYTGAVYEAHYDAFRNLLAAIQRLTFREIRLHVYTAQSPEKLVREEGMTGPIEFHDHRALSDMPGIQRGADLLFLPLAFQSPYPEIIRTSAPGKIGEYLAARRPVLAHAPADSFVAWYFRKHDCGVVVDQLAPAVLADAIEGILGNRELQRGITDKAWHRAREDFDLSRTRATFLNLVLSQ
jgi:glycosyltransferase involved in cell wall biosynthesis